MDHSKKIDLYFSELYWSTFLGSVQKNRYRNIMAYRKKCVCMFSHGKRFSTRKSAFHHKVATNDRYRFYGGQNLLILVRHRYGPEVTNVTKSHNCDFLSQFRNCDFPPISMPHQNKQVLFSIKTVPIISGNFVMKSRFACAESFAVQKHTKMTSLFVSVTFFSGQNLENSTNIRGAPLLD